MEQEAKVAQQLGCVLVQGPLPPIFALPYLLPLFSCSDDDEEIISIVRTLFREYGLLPAL